MKRVLIAGLGLMTVFVIGVKLLAVTRDRFERRRLIAEQEQVLLPQPEEPALQPLSAGAVFSSVRAEVNWDVPFTPQAPHARWDALHQEACEEASVLMVLRYFSGQRISGADDAERGILHLVAANEALGFGIDDTAEEAAALLLSQDSSLSVALLKNPSVHDLKSALSMGSLVIVPAAGQQLFNPYFQTPGPRYHMLVLRGYTDDFAIANDPGTRNGWQFAYRWDVLMNAIHDWNGGDVESGEKVVIIVRKAVVRE